KAFVVLREGEQLTAEDLTEFLKQRLSPIEMPKLIEFRESLPKTLIGKPSKRALEEEEAARAQGRKPAPPDRQTALTMQSVDISTLDSSRQLYYVNVSFITFK